jgi:hypothetical protein
MIKIENTEPMTPDGPCSLAIATVGLWASSSGGVFVVKTASPSAFSGSLFEAYQAQVDEISETLGNDWSVSLGESGLVTCTKV